MNEVLASFVGQVGPGQIVDHHSLATVPTGFLKIGICNDVNDLCLFIGEFRESLEEPNLDLKLSIKASLHTGEEVLEGLTIIRSRIAADSKANRELVVVKFDKSAFADELVAEFDDYDVIGRNDETLQVAVYAWRSSGRLRTKCRIGFVYVRLGDVTRNESRRFNAESWYKVFPNPSLLLGRPTSGLSGFYVSSPLSPSSTPVTPVSPEVLKLVNPILKGSEELPSTSSSACENGDGDLPKKNSFKNVAKAFVKLMQKQREDQAGRNASKSAGETQARAVQGASFTNRPKTWSSFSEKVSASRTRNQEKSGLQRQQSTRFENIIRLKLGRSLSKSSSLNSNQVKFKRCDEVICSPSPGRIRRVRGLSVEERHLSFDYAECSINSIQNSFHDNRPGDDVRRNCFRKSKQNSVDSGSGGSSSFDTDDSTSLQNQTLRPRTNYLKLVSFMHTWTRRVQKKTNQHSRSPSLTPDFPNVADYEENDNVYDVLKQLQTIPKAPDNDRPPNKQMSSCSGGDSSNSLNDTKSEEKVELSLSPATSPPATPVPVTRSSSADAPPERSSEPAADQVVRDPITCTNRREKFARNRSLAIERSDHDSLSLTTPPSTKELESDDDYMTCCDDDYTTCCDKMSSSNWSVASFYTTASEAAA